MSIRDIGLWFSLMSAVLCRRCCWPHGMSTKCSLLFVCGHYFFRDNIYFFSPTILLKACDAPVETLVSRVSETLIILLSFFCLLLRPSSSSPCSQLLQGQMWSLRLSDFFISLVVFQLLSFCLVHCRAFQFLYWYFLFGDTEFSYFSSLDMVFSSSLNVFIIANLLYLLIYWGGID